MSIEQSEAGPSPDEDIDIIAEEVSGLFLDEDRAAHEPRVKKSPESQLAYYIERTSNRELRERLFGRLAHRKP